MITKKDQEVALALRQLVTAMNKRLRKQISNPEHLSIAELNVVGMLMQQKEMLPSELGAQLHISSQFMSQVLKRLLDLGYISRRISPEDKRKNLISLTKAGVQKVEHTRREREEWLAAQIAEIFTSKEKDTIKSTLALLKRLEDRIPIMQSKI
ncbi:DNA-binding MarR family transcriptional regulator [Chitinophaga dinghuensis]|uniref:DNA-binding MarR family transcriptional regulator n=1 Tax=Chitinophaga dinghuensis TaxID=1539050 RepID=A0A327WF02_9BACT|nr:MarR family transcriptional regulator [Chitinophaga dinghuensis]RAJ87986.1 DNA-binding MarR family transcriptional regulator [Chitinophaga dinghuensis]